jgi:hypothetical protein
VSFTALSAGVTAAAEWAALHYAFTAHRAAVKVMISHDTATLTPFVNTTYHNTIAWNVGARPLRFVLPSGRECSMDEYYARKAAMVTGFNEMEDRGFIRSQEGWWLNGHTLCNVVPANLWSLRGLTELEAMIGAAAPMLQRLGVHGCFVLNKRDSPMLPADDEGHPFPALVEYAGAGGGGARMHPMYVRPMRPPLSFYTGPAWRDVALPLPEAWTWATRADADGGGALLARCFASEGRLDAAWFATKRRQAVFRGTPTGPGVGHGNQRVALCTAAARMPALLDAGLTARNARDRVHAGIVRFQWPSTELVPPMPPVAQAQHRVLVYACGHQAASRLIWHLASGCALVLIDPPPDVLGPHMWLHAFLEEGVHYVRARADMSDLGSVISSLLADDVRAAQLASAAYALANRVLRPNALVEATAQALVTAAAGIGI